MASLSLCSFKRQDVLCLHGWRSHCTITIKKFPKIWKEGRVNPILDQRLILFPSAKTIEKKVLSDSRKEYAVNIPASLYFVL